ncbi:MAG: VOC family protein [Anaerolineales bacterium]
MINIGSRVVPALLARNLPESIRFYQGILGFRLTGCYPDQDNPTWAELTRDGVVIQFYSDPPEGTQPTPVMSGTLYLFPESVESLAAEFAGRVPFAWGPEVMDYGLREFGIRDPNGYFLAFAELAKPAIGLDQRMRP